MMIMFYPVSIASLLEWKYFHLISGTRQIVCLVSLFYEVVKLFVIGTIGCVCQLKERFETIANIVSPL